MKLKNKKFIIFVSVGLVLIVSMYFAFNKKEEYKELPRVRLKERSKLKQFALMIEQTKGTGDYEDKSEEYASAFPTEGYRLNEDMSGCTDMNGKEIEGALSYDIGTYTIIVNTNKTAYCYLYYDIYEKPSAEGTQLEGKEGLTKDLVGGMFRYQGTDNVPNWIIFGTTEECNKDEEENCTNEKLGEMTYAEYVDKYMYRIIGITQSNQLYLLKETFLKEGSVTGFAWNNEYVISGSATYLCPDGVCPEWNEASLFKRINGTSNGSIAGAGGTSTKSNTDIFVDSEYYDYLKSGDTVNGGGTEEKNGEEATSDWYKLIANHDWMYGDTTENSSNKLYNGNEMYAIETGNTPTSHYAKGEDGTVSSQSTTWNKEEDYVTAKISLMYIHDMDYAYPEGIPNNYTNVKNSWIHFQKDGYNSNPTCEWLSTRWGIYNTSGTGVRARYVYNNGVLSNNDTLYRGYGVRPVFYLSSEAKITGGEGTQSLPYILG